MQKKLKNISYYILPIIILFSQNIKADEKLDIGKEIFLGKGTCALCHTLADAGSEASVGPNLNEIVPDMMRVMHVVRNGNGVMPAFEGQLTNEEIEAVSYYVSESTK